MITLTKPALRALIVHACADDTRSHINAIHVDADAGCCVATDGHRLARYTPTGGVGEHTVTIPLRFWEQAYKLARVKVPIQIETFADGAVLIVGEVRIVCTVVDHFPPTEQVIPAPRTVTPCAVIGLNTRYLSQLDLVGKACSPNAPHLKIQIPPDSMSPIRADIDHPESGAWTVVIMPVRL